MAEFSKFITMPTSEKIATIKKFFKNEKEETKVDDNE
jgi:hypothetical protein